MFLGHYGVAFALKRAEPKVSLGTLFVAVQLADVLWGCFLLLGWEQVRIDPSAGPVAPLEFVHYPISHSLVGSLAWAVAAGAVYYSWPTRDTSRHWQAAVLVTVAAASHWFLDAIVHFPDLPLAGEGSPQIGFGLWSNLPLTIALELLVFGTGVAIYVIRRSHRHPARPGPLVGLVLLLLALYAASVVGPPPPSETAIAVTDLVGLLGLAALAGWVDRRADPKELAGAGLPRR
ncbi:MAG TPA: hypothetical protein VJQ44_09685 [Gemmatimonadales bacterium]|nr:hypothetical protein [Gemmatimonadales bacterium]